jgi:hypothetical protein
MMLPSVASADPGNGNTVAITLDCRSAGTFDAVFTRSGTAAFHLVGTTANFEWKTLSYIDPTTGQPVSISSGTPGKGFKHLLTCTYTAGLDFTVVGFMTPAG